MWAIRQLCLVSGGTPRSDTLRLDSHIVVRSRHRHASGLAAWQPCGMFAQPVRHTDEFDDAVRLLVDVPEPPRIVIIQRFALNHVPGAYLTAADQNRGAIKVVIQL